MRLLQTLTLSTLIIATSTAIATAKTRPTNPPTLAPPIPNVTLPGELVTNGGFETGDFSGFTVTSSSADSSLILVSTSATTREGSYAPYSGTYFAELGPIALSSLSQNLNTVVGTTYNLSYFLASDGQFPNQFQTTVGNTTVSNLINIPSQPYTPYSFRFTATGASTPLTFDVLDENSYLALDNISVTPAATSVPEPSTIVGTLFLGAGYLLHQRRKSSI